MLPLKGMLTVPGGMIILLDNDQMWELLHAWDTPASLSLCMDILELETLFLVCTDTSTQVELFT